MRDAMEHMNMTARTHDRILKVARTIARHQPHRNLDCPTYLGNL